MTAPIISFEAYRRTGRIVRCVPVQYDDARLEFARQVEERAYAMEMAKFVKWACVNEGKLPARFAEDTRPSDTDGDAA